LRNIWEKPVLVDANWADKSAAVTFPKSLSVTLHFLRGISAQAVVIGHGLNFAGVGYAVRPPNFPFIQNIGVIVFFFMSGLVICHSIQTNTEKGEYGFFTFLVDRAIRLMITIIPCLLVIFVFDQFSVGSPIFASKIESATSIPQFFGNILMLQFHPLFSVEPFGSARPLWSVALEWWTYVFFGFLILFQHTEPKMRWLTLPVFLLSWPMVLPAIFGTRRLVFVWMLGAVSSYVIMRLPRIKSQLNCVAAICVFVLLLPLLYIKLLKMADGFSMGSGISVSIFLFGILYFLSHLKIAGVNFFSSAIKLTADYSFTLYYIHYSLFILLVTATDLRGYLLLFAGFLVSNVLSLGIASVTEMRYKRYRCCIKSKLARLRPNVELRQAP
jgi:peptidoglycan/LPS O-acetylase OafA/YrhL